MLEKVEILIVIIVLLLAFYFIISWELEKRKILQLRQKLKDIYLEYVF